jgi:hypothetical protein
MILRFPAEVDVHLLLMYASGDLIVTELPSLIGPVLEERAIETHFQTLSFRKRKISG